MASQSVASQSVASQSVAPKSTEEHGPCKVPSCKAKPTVFPIGIDGTIWPFCPPHSLVAKERMEVLQYAKARKDFNVFAELVCTDDVTGENIKQAPIHRRWAQLADEHDRLIIWSHVEAGKTVQLSMLRTVWELGNNPRLRFVILSGVASQATKIVRTIAQYIESNETVRKIFPALQPDPNGPWTTTELQVKRPNKGAKDASVQAAGVHANITGGRIDRLVIDDILSLENTNTPANRKNVDTWIRSVAFGRLTKTARVLIVGNAWHPEDLLHELAASGAYRWVRFPILDKHGNITWPEAWDAERIEKKRKDLGTSEEFARQMLCQARDDASSRFKQADIDKAIAKGRGLSLVANIADVAGSVDGGPPEGCFTFTGVDLAMSKSKRSDDTVLFTFMEDPKGNRTVLNIEVGKFTGSEIVTKIVDHHRRYKSTIAVESNAAQKFIHEFTTDQANIPVVPHVTTKAKLDPKMGVESLSIELANGKWIIPSYKATAKEVDRWIREMLFYSPHAHTGDVLMACYFARVLATRMMGSSSGTSASVVFKSVGVNAEKPPEERMEDFNARVNTISTTSDEEARRKDQRPGWQ